MCIEPSTQTVYFIKLPKAWFSNHRDISAADIRQWPKKMEHRSTLKYKRYYSRILKNGPLVFENVGTYNVIRTFLLFLYLRPVFFFYQKSQNFNTDLLILKYHLKTKLINFMNFKFWILKKKIECGRMFLFIRCLYNAYRMDISRNGVNQIKYKHWKNYQC